MKPQPAGSPSPSPSPSRSRSPSLSRSLPCLLACAALLAPSLASAQVLRPVTSGLRQPVSSSLLLDDGTALTANPATLGFSGGPQFIYAHENALGGFGLQNNGFYVSTALGPLALGASVEWLRAGNDCSFSEPCVRRSSLGIALAGDQLSLGAAFHQLDSYDRAELDGTISWDVGAAFRPLECAAIGFAALDVFAPRVGGNELPRRFVGSLAVRPVCDRVTLAVDAEFSSCTGTPAFALPSSVRSCGLEKPDLRFTADATVFAGLKLLGQLSHTAQDEKWSGQVGLAVDTGNLGVRGIRSFGEGPGQRFGMSVRASAERFPALPPIRRSAVWLDLDKALSPPLFDLLAFVRGKANQNPLTKTLAALRRLGDDNSVSAVVFKLANLPIGGGQTEELRNGIAALRAKNKKVVFYLENAGNLEYDLASVADRIYAAPQAVLAINGFSATSFFLAAGLDKLGVKAEFFRVGAYKNAPDMFTRSEMSSEQREATQALLDDRSARFEAAVLGGRKIDALKWKALLDQGLVTPQKAVDSGLVDGLLYPDQFEEELGKVLGAGGKVSMSRRTTEPPLVRDDRWGERSRIGIVRVEGNIMTGGGSAGSDRIARRIRHLADDAATKAIVVRIDSPGGDGNASDLIWRELTRARKEKGKPVVASMGDVAASGGYYVAVGADAIYAQPSTITGSIGVFMGHFDTSGLLAKLGVSAVTIKQHESGDLFGVFRPTTAAEKLKLQAWVDSFYESFLSRVAEGRKLSRDGVHALAQGRVWSGTRALDKGLIDKLGGLDDAILDARKRAGLPDDEDVELDDDLQSPTDLLDSSQDGVSLALERVLGANRLDALELMRAALVDTALAPAITSATRTLTSVGAPYTLRARMEFDLDLH